jgi:alpha-D-ribose 1-methylphosphonate 5-triphosphate synthase subunit PhnH
MTMLAAGFADQVLDGQRAFRAAMDALARPGEVSSCGAGLPQHAPLPHAAAALILALCDYETTLHLSPSLAARAGVADYLRFHTDARLVAAPSHAAFAIVDLGADVLSLEAYAQGVAEYPDRSTTIIALTRSVTEGAAVAIAGPGVAAVATLRVSDLPDDFAAQWAANRARFPLGVDILFAAAEQIVALPRSARIIEGAA